MSLRSPTEHENSNQHRSAPNRHSCESRESRCLLRHLRLWIPAFAGMTDMVFRFAIKPSQLFSEEDMEIFRISFTASARKERQ